MEPVPEFLLKKKVVNAPEKPKNPHRFRHQLKEASTPIKKNKPVIIMSKTSFFVLIVLVLILCFLFFLTGFLISKSLHKNVSHQAQKETSAASTHSFNLTPPPKHSSHQNQNAIDTMVTSNSQTSSHEDGKTEAATPHTGSKKPLQHFNKMVGVHHQGEPSHSSSHGTTHPTSGSSNASHRNTPPVRKGTSTPAHTDSTSPHATKNSSHKWPAPTSKNQRMHIDAHTSSNAHTVLSQSNPMPPNYNNDVDMYKNPNPSFSGINTQNPWTETTHQPSPANQDMYAFEGSDSQPSLLSPFNAPRQEDAFSPKHPTFSHPRGYSLQIGAYQDMDRAQEMAQNLSHYGFESAVYHGWDHSKKPWYFVRVGHYTHEHEAQRSAQVFMNQFQRPTLVVENQSHERKIL